MEESTTTPVHLWIVGALSLLWNAFGGYDYTMTRMRNLDYLSSMPGIDANQMLAYIDSFPMYAQIGWGLGVWGAVAGSILLLLRHRFAVIAFAVSLIGALLSLGYQVVGPPGPAALSAGAIAVVPYVIIALTIAQLLYAQSMRTKGVLR